MRLSFVVPAYNEEAYLPACLESILAQTSDLGDDVEIIVVNNASTDRTREVALKYPGVRVVDEPRKGLTFARQAGFAASTGELIANVDSDSRLTPGWVKRVLKEFAADPKLVSLSGPFIYYDLTPQQRLSVRDLLRGGVYGVCGEPVYSAGGIDGAGRELCAAARCAATNWRVRHVDLLSTARTRISRGG